MVEKSSLKKDEGVMKGGNRTDDMEEVDGSGVRNVFCEIEL